MARPKICAVITGDDVEAARSVESLVDLFEVRIDLIGDAWEQLVKQLGKPWIACNRLAAEGGNWRGGEDKRVARLLKAVELGADMVDIELASSKLADVVKLVKPKARCIISSHNLSETLPLATMREIVHRQIHAGADVCKLVTTAQKFADNLAVLQLIRDFPESRIVSFAMGPLGQVSRVLCPLVGGDFTYASLAEGKESAPGQIAARDLRQIYGMLRDGW